MMDAHSHDYISTEQIFNDLLKPFSQNCALSHKAIGRNGAPRPKFIALCTTASNVVLISTKISQVQRLKFTERNPLLS